MRILVTGDLHGNIDFTVTYVFYVAARCKANVIVQVGDYGFWEHTPDGTVFNDAVEEAVQTTGIGFTWLRGNHDKLSLLLERYGHQRTSNGLIRIRDGVHYIPDGHIWTWGGKRIRAFGGAYSVDKPFRLRREAELGGLIGGPEAAEGMLWFPEEEITDEQYAALLAADSSKMDIIFSHDKPYAANTSKIRLDDNPDAVRNQRWLQRALTAHKPQWWFHGHLHTAYRDTVRCGDDDAYTAVVGLACDAAAAPRFWRPTDSWCLLDLNTDEPITYTTGRAAGDQ